MKQFLIEVKSEFSKIVWPSKDQIKNATVVVVALSVVMGLYLGMFDFIFSKFLEKIVGV